MKLSSLAILPGRDSFPLFQTRNPMKLPIALLSLPILLASTGCSSTGASSASAAEPSHPPAAKPEDADAADKLLKGNRELDYAKMELDLSKMSIAAETRESENAVIDATQKLEAVKRDRDNFKGREKPEKIADKQLDIDRAAWRMEESRQELAELESMYKKEDFAGLTKELVLQRGKKNLEFAQRGLDLAKQSQEQLVSHELAKKELELDQAVERAEKALAEANAKKEKCATECKLKGMKAEHRVDEQQRAVDKMKSKEKPKDAPKEAPKETKT
jgi:hypothetical protein